MKVFYGSQSTEYLSHPPSTTMTAPTFVDVRAARRQIQPYLRSTPLFEYPLSALLGAKVWVKHENHQPIGTFQVRGGINSNFPLE